MEPNDFEKCNKLTKHVLNDTNSYKYVATKLSCSNQGCQDSTIYFLCSPVDCPLYDLLWYISSGISERIFKYTTEVRHNMVSLD